MAFTIECALPAIHQQAQLVLAPDERSQSTRHRRCSEPLSHSAWLDYTVKLKRPFHAFERLRTAIFNHEQPGDQLMRSRGYQYRAGSGRCLHPRGYVRSIAENIGILARAGANHHRT